MKKMYFAIQICIFLLTISLLQAEEVILTCNDQVFKKPKKEYKIVSYFLSFQQKKYYKSLKKEEKAAFLKSFWKSNDPNPVTEINEFLEQVKERIVYSNQHFSHFKDGWETDRGRIYIRHGEPFDIYKDRTSVTTKYAIKDYQIWKYRLSEDITYIFIDQQMYGDYRLIYAEGDDIEFTNPEWLDFMGHDFDMSLLE